jgi:MFS family permease
MFLFAQLGNILQGLGFFMPTLYLPTYARALGIESAAVTATIALLNGATVFGCIAAGMLCDRLHVTTVILLSTIGATFSVFVLWGLSASIPLLCVFSIVYGFFAGGFSSTYAGVMRDVSLKQPGSDPGMVLGVLAAGRGIGSVICGPLSEALIKTRAWEGQAVLGYGTGYGPLIVFTGVSALLGGVSFGARRLGWT